MKRAARNLNRPSLAQHFTPPEGFVGHFAWVCGYSADALFLNDASERFTCLTESQRAHHGRTAMAVMLDPHAPQIDRTQAPGVEHLPIKPMTQRPFRLLHAKVALMGFKNIDDVNKWQLRLLVSTGNWTRQTVEESLDLARSIDVSSESLDAPTTAVQADCADIKAAWNLMTWVQKLFDCRTLDTSANERISETAAAMDQVKNWIESSAKRAKGSSRFFDNRTQSLLVQIPKTVMATRDSARNYLAMGSGFYESSSIASQPPTVVMKILEVLSEEGLLTNNRDVDLYVNPLACQSIAKSVEALKKHRITVRPAATPPSVFGEGTKRGLHAKFLFSANWCQGSNRCTSAWVYLGSGNLTHPGFVNAMSKGAGNLEAGVVFSPSDLYWHADEASPGHEVVTDLLPIQWKDEVTDQATLSAGAAMQQTDEEFVAPPFAWLSWHSASDEQELRPSQAEAIDANMDACHVIDLAGNTCVKTPTGFQWLGEQPRQVRVRWRTSDVNHESLVPIMDEFGRLAATPLQAIDLNEALWQLADFPQPPGDEDSSEDDSTGDSKARSSSSTAKASTYPIRQMMELIESIAAKQTEIGELDWSLWCNRLEQTLGQASDSEPVKYFRECLKLNPLSALRHAPFRPAFAECDTSQPGTAYKAALNGVENRWAVQQLHALGDEA